MPYTETSDKTRLFHIDWGSGKPVVFTHAWGLNSDMWNYQLPSFIASGLRCVAFDRRGHGRSDRPGRGYDYDTFADDLAALIERLDLRDVTLVGHSAGCGEVVRYLSRHGDERVERAVLLAPVTPLIVTTEDNPEGLDPAVLAAGAAALVADVPAWCAENAPPFFGATPVSPGLVDWVTRQIVDTPLQILLETAAAYTTTDFRADLAAVRVPTLVVHGDLDASAPIDLTGRRTAALIAGSRLLVYEGSGHGLYAADHARLNPDALAFIGEQRAMAA
jgi:non-heme chloroperoxidase